MFFKTLFSALYKPEGQAWGAVGAQNASFNQKIEKASLFLLVFNLFSTKVFFVCFYHLWKNGCNSAEIGHKNKNYIPNERYCPRLFAS